MPNFIKSSSIPADVNHKSFHLFCGLLILGIFLGGCKSSVFTDQIKEGIVQYDINYTNNSGRNFPMQLLPKTMELRFNKNFVSFKIEDRVGLFSICNINDLSHKNHVTLIKVFDKKYAYKGEIDEAPLFYSNSSFTITPIKDTIRLIGVLCHKANVVFANSTKTFNIVYYTNIGFHNPNKNTPYEKIDGLLFDFMIQLKNIDMRLIAKKIEGKEMTDSEFTIPEGYKFIPKSKMEEIITTILP